MTLFQTRTIYFRGRYCGVVLQAQNGPCPLIATVNVLSLRGSLSVLSNADRDGRITHQILVNLLAETVLHRLQQQEAMRQLAAQRSSPATTPSVSARSSASKRVCAERGDGRGSRASSSDVLAVPAANPTDPCSSTVAFVVRSPASRNPPKTPTTREFLTVEVLDFIPRMATGMHLNVRFRNIDDMEPTPEVAVMDACGIRVVHGWLVDEQDDMLRREVGADNYNTLVAAMAADEKPFFKNFVESYPTQLTTAGLFALQEGIADGELCILFRNNHFSVLSKHEGVLIELITDVAVAASVGGNVAWQTLQDLDGGATRFLQTEREPVARRLPTSQAQPAQGCVLKGTVVRGHADPTIPTARVLSAPTKHRIMQQENTSCIIM